MTAVAGPEPRDDDWMTSEVQRQEATAAVVIAEALCEKEVTLMKTRLLRRKKRGQSSGSDTMLEI